LVYAGTAAAIDPCALASYGETHDYTVEIIAAVPCAGMPNTASVTAPSSVCAGTSFTLMASGLSTGLDLEYQWEESTDGGMTWTPIVGATSAQYTVAGGITMPTEYRFVTTCLNGGDQSISAPEMVNLNPFYSCYCPATNLGGSQITNITIVGTTMNHTTGGGPSPYYYTAYPDTGVATATLVQGVSYPVSMTFDGSAIGSIWIDYNQDGVYDATEWVQTGTTGTSHSATITVPITALPGPTGMRVRSRGSGNANGATDACTAMGGGETEDYIITIAAATACAGQPDPVTVTGPTSVCIGTDIQLVASGATTGLDIDYQWEESTDGGITWTPIAGANNITHTIVGGITVATDYRFVTTCLNGGAQDISPAYTVA